jgi:hypothetical protein
MRIRNYENNATNNKNYKYCTTQYQFYQLNTCLDLHSTDLIEPVSEPMEYCDDKEKRNIAD